MKSVLVDEYGAKGLILKRLKTLVICLCVEVGLKEELLDV